VVLVATGVSADGHREILGVEVTSSEDGAGWPAFVRGLVARGLSGVQLVISDAHRGLVERSDRRCRARPGSDAAPTGAVRNQLVDVSSSGGAAARSSAAVR
jgi:hypothetical protein